MKKLLFLIGVIIGLNATGQYSTPLKFVAPRNEPNFFKAWKFYSFPNTDSLRSYNNKWITNNAATAFTNLRLHYLLEGIIDFLDDALEGGGGNGNYGIDSIAALNDTTIRYRKNGSFKTFNFRGKNWTLQQVLNNGNVLVENESIQLLDSLIFASGLTVADSIRLRNVVAVNDTTVYKPAVFDRSGNMKEFISWPKSGIPGSGAAQQITFWRGTSSIGGKAGMTVDTAANKMFLDSMQVRKTLEFPGDINRGSSSFETSAIRFGSPSNYFRNSDDATNSDGKLWIAYPKYSCDTCTGNQPFYSDIGTTIYDVAQPANSVINLVRFGSGAANKPMARVALEQNYYGDAEFHVAAFKPIGDLAEIRAISVLGKFSNGQTTGLFRFSSGNFTDPYAKHEYLSFTPNSFNIKPVVRNTGEVTEINITPLDTPSMTIRGGLKIMNQHSGGEWLNTINWGGQQLNFNSNGLNWNSFGSGAGNSGRNFIFSTSAGNGQRIMWVGNDWGGSYNQAYEVYASGNTVFGPINTADAGYRLQAHGAGVQFASFTRTGNTNSVTPAGYFWNTSTGTTAAGYGSSIALAGQARADGFLGMTYLGSAYTDVTDGSEDADFIISNLRNGSVTQALRSLSSGALRINNAYTLPATDGAANQVLKTDGSGNVTFGSASNISNTALTWDGDYIQNVNHKNLFFDSVRQAKIESIEFDNSITSRRSRMLFNMIRGPFSNFDVGGPIFAFTLRRANIASDSIINSYSFQSGALAMSSIHSKATTVMTADIAVDSRRDSGRIRLNVSETGNGGGGSRIDVTKHTISLNARDTLLIRTQSLPVATGDTVAVLVPANAPETAAPTLRVGKSRLPASYMLSDSASGVANVDINLSTFGNFDRITIYIEKLEVATDNVDLYMRFSSDGGSTFNSGASDYEWTVGWQITQATGINADAADDHIALVQNIGNSAGYSAAGEVELLHPLDANYRPLYKGQFICNASSGAIIRSNQGGQQSALGPITTARLYLSSGNIDKIKYRVVGHRN